MFDLSNYPHPDFIPDILRAQPAEKFSLVDLGFKVLEAQQVQRFMDFFQFGEAVAWFNEPLIPKNAWTSEASHREIQQIMHGGFMRPDIIIFRPPASIFIVEFTRKVTTRTLGQCLHYRYLYKQYFGNDFILHTIAVFDSLVTSVIEHMIKEEILPIYQIAEHTTPTISHQFAQCFLSNGHVDIGYAECDFLKTLDNYYRAANQTQGKEK